MEEKQEHTRSYFHRSFVSCLSCLTPLPGDTLIILMVVSCYFVPILYLPISPFSIHLLDLMPCLVLLMVHYVRGRQTGICLPDLTGTCFCQALVENHILMHRLWLLLSHNVRIELLRQRTYAAYKAKKTYCEALYRES